MRSALLRLGRGNPPEPPLLPGEHTLDSYNKIYTEATKRANKLFLSLLSMEQHACLFNFGYVPVISDRDERWRVCCNSIEGNSIRERNRVGYCAHLPRYGQQITVVRADGSKYQRWTLLPYADHWIAQMMAIQTDQEAFLNTAVELEKYLPFELPGDLSRNLKNYVLL